MLIVGAYGLGRLEVSYQRAFESIGCVTTFFDIEQSVKQFCRFGRIGQQINRFISIEPWIAKANREFVTTAMNEHPDIVLVGGQSPVRAGALAQIATSVGSKFCLVWPDPLAKLPEWTIDCLPLYDLIAACSQSTLQSFHKLGARRAEWIPLAGDPTLHSNISPPTSDELEIYGCDVSFVGNWRPEREEVLSSVVSMKGIALKIWGENDWRRFAGNKQVTQRAWQGKPLYADTFAKAVLSSKLNLNIIDPTNYPGANMRFFEIPCAGGLQVCSPCPEWEEEFKDEETIFYYRRAEELSGLILFLLADDALRHRVAQTAHEKVLSAHTYAHRAVRILELLSEESR